LDIPSHSNQKLLSKEANDNLLQYYKKNDIKKVSLEDNSSLVIEHNNNNNNNNEIVSLEQIENDFEIENVKN
jgi:hypothetical protein